LEKGREEDNVPASHENEREQLCRTVTYSCEKRIEEKRKRRKKMGTIKRWAAIRQPRGVKPPQLDIMGLTRVPPAAPCGWHSFDKS
jgi:hypothetical protein